MVGDCKPHRAASETCFRVARVVRGRRQVLKRGVRSEVVVEVRVRGHGCEGTGIAPRIGAEGPFVSMGPMQPLNDAVGLGVAHTRGDVRHARPADETAPLTTQD